MAHFPQNHGYQKQSSHTLLEDISVRHIKCVPAWLNEALCGETDFDLQAKIWTKVKIFHFLFILSKSSFMMFLRGNTNETLFGNYLYNLTKYCSKIGQS